MNHSARHTHPILLSALRAAAIFCALWALSGCCSNDAPVPENADPPQATKEGALDPEPEPTPDLIVALVDGHAIHNSQVDAELERALAIRAQVGQPASERWKAHKRRRILQDLIERHLIRKTLAARGLTIEEDAVTERLNKRIKDTFHARPAFERYLGKIGQTEARYRDDIRDELAVEMLLGNAWPSNVDETACQTYYDKRKNLFKAKARARLAVIVLKTRKGMAPDTMDGVRLKAESLSKTARGGADFAALAQEHSEGPTASGGGNLGWVYASNLDEALVGPAFEMAVNAVSDPIRTRVGFQVLKVLDRRPEGHRGFDEVHKSIERQLLSRQRREARQELLKDLKRAAAITLHEDKLNPQKRR